MAATVTVTVTVTWVTVTPAGHECRRLQLGAPGRGPDPGHPARRAWDSDRNGQRGVRPALLDSSRLLRVRLPNLKLPCLRAFAVGS